MDGASRCREASFAPNRAVFGLPRIGISTPCDGRVGQPPTRRRVPQRVGRVETREFESRVRAASVTRQGIDRELWIRRVKRRGRRHGIEVEILRRPRVLVPTGVVAFGRDRPLALFEVPTYFPALHVGLWFPRASTRHARRALGRVLGVGVAKICRPPRVTRDPTSREAERVRPQRVRKPVRMFERWGSLPPGAHIRVSLAENREGSRSERTSSRTSSVAIEDEAHYQYHCLRGGREGD